MGDTRWYAKTLRRIILRIILILRIEARRCAESKRRAFFPLRIARLSPLKNKKYAETFFYHSAYRKNKK
jgi:hypothetical protein